MKITDLATLKKHAPQLDAELKQVFAKYGLEFHGRSAKIGGGELTYKITCKTGSKEDQMELAQKRFAMVAPGFDLDPGLFGKYFTYGGWRYRVVGIDTKKYKMPVVLERQDGRQMKAAPQMLRGQKFFDMEVPA